MAVVIVNVSDTVFSLNGIEYEKNFQSLVFGNNVEISNVYDSKVIIQARINYADYTVNGTSYTSAALLQSALVGVLFRRGLEDIENRLDNLEENQVTGVHVYETFASLPVTGALLVSYKVSNDPDSSKNGYYHWSGTVYVKDAELGEDFIEEINLNKVNISENKLNNDITKSIEEFSFVSDFELNFSYVIKGSGYWGGTVGQEVEVVASGTRNYMYLIEGLKIGDTVTVKNTYGVAGTVAFVEVDKDDIYLRRVDFDNADSEDYINGNFVWTIKEVNCKKIGFGLLNSDPSFPLSGVTVTINDGVETSVFPSDEYAENISEKIGISSTKEIEEFCFDVEKQINFNYSIDGSGYWGGTVGQEVEVVASGTRNYMNLVSGVKFGDTITIRNTYGVAGTVAFVEVDKDNIYLKRVDFDNADSEDYINGNFVFTVSQKDTYKIGFGLLNSDPSFPLSGVTVTINDGVEYSVSPTDKYTLNIAEKLKSEVSMYDRGNSPKEYSSKKVGIIVAGQSNTDGRVPDVDFPSTYIDDDGFVTNYLDGSSQIPLSKYSKNVEDGSLSVFTLPSLWAYDAIVLSKLCHKLNDTVYMMKQSLGGTAISVNGTDGGGFWTPRFEDIDAWNESEGKTNTKLTSLFEEQIRKTKGGAEGDLFEIKCMLWHQGEGDSTEVKAENDYYKNLKEVIAYVRGVVGNPVLPVIYGTISHLRPSGYSKIVEDAFFRIASEDSFVYVIDMSAGTLLDGFHFDAASTEYLGTEMYKIIRDDILKL